MLGVVPAAGEGTRLRPLTANQPKAMVTIDGRPLLTHVFETLLDSGVTELIVVVGYKADAIHEQFGESFRGCPITYVHQRDQLGLGHAVSLTAPHVHDPFVVLNGDNVIRDDVRQPIRRFQDSDTTGVIAVDTVDRATAKTTGVVLTDDDQRVTRIVEKPTDPPSTCVTTGCYVLSTAIFDALELLRPSARGEYELADAIGVLVRAGAPIEAVTLPGDRVNVNAPADIKRAEQLLATAS